MRVRVRNNNVEGALRILKRKIKEDNLITRLKEIERYEKPCSKRNKSKSSAKLRERRRQEKHDKPRKSY
jgi:small subunit ribosomal protein S21